MDNNKLAQKALQYGCGNISMYVWEACCNKHGVGGTPKAIAMYERIMKTVVEEYEGTSLEHETWKDWFDEFWKEYPNKKAKPLALRAWMKLKLDMSGETYLEIMKSLEAHKKSFQWAKDAGQFIPHPSTWLNQRRWEDELKVEGQGSTKYSGL